MQKNFLIAPTSNTGAAHGRPGLASGRLQQKAGHGGDGRDNREEGHGSEPLPRTGGLSRRQDSGSERAGLGLCPIASSG